LFKTGTGKYTLFLKKNHFDGSAVGIKPLDLKGFTVVFSGMLLFIETEGIIYPQNVKR
jgi:hypothetical protein